MNEVVVPGLVSVRLLALAAVAAVLDAVEGTLVGAATDEDDADDDDEPTSDEVRDDNPLEISQPNESTRESAAPSVIPALPKRLSE